MVEENNNYRERERETANLRLVNLTFDTQTGIETLVKEKIAEMTVIPRRMINSLALQMTRELARSPERVRLEIPLTKIWRVCFFMLMRSVGAGQLNKAVMLAESQLATQTEEAGEAWEM